MGPEAEAARRSVMTSGGRVPVSASQRPLQCRTPIWDPTINVKRVLLPPFGSWPWENLISWPDLLAMRLLPLGMRELWGIFARRFW